MQYPKTSKDLLQTLKDRRFAHDAKLSGAVKRDKTIFWPKQFSRLELNGQEVRSVVAWSCSTCHAQGVATSHSENGNEVPCWHCSECNEHTDFQVVTNLR